MKDAAACVSARFHGVVVSLALGLPTIGVEYDPKVRNLLRLFGLDEWLAPKADQADLGSFQARIEGMVRSSLDGCQKPDYREFSLRFQDHENALGEFKELLWQPKGF